MATEVTDLARQHATVEVVALVTLRLLPLPLTEVYNPYR